ncbi:MAG: queuosine precursor transporter [Sphaerochaetaceae bacterium]
MNTSKKELFLLALYITFMVLVNTIGSKITTICNVRISVGIFFMPVLFLITDIVGEVKGQKRATLFVQLAEMMLVILFAMTFLCVKLRPNETWGMQEQYTAIFGSSMRMTVASILSFIISQNLDVSMFFRLRKVSGGRKLWIRNNVATIISQGVDTTIFMFLAFYHINAKYTAAFVFSLVLPYWIFKIILALLDTPFCYLGVKWLRKGSSLSDEVSVS